MGTRSLTHIKDDVWEEGETPKTIVTIYRQMDGYPEGLGAELAEFLAPFTIVNGFGGGDPTPVANGMGCLAAQVVAHLKDGVGSVYLYPPDSEDCGEEYVYTIAGGRGGLNLKCEGVNGGYGDKPRELEVLFDGAPEAFPEWVKTRGRDD
jgi:hypothetical protein